MTGPRILIAGIGNIFLGDDAFGVEVARQLAGRPLPPGVRVGDFGIRSFDLIYALLEDYDAAILVDAAPRGGAPGTLYVIEPELPDMPRQENAAELTIQTHDMDPLKVLRLVGAMGGQLRHILVVGCEPAPLQSDQDISDGLSPAVRAAVEQAVGLIESLIDKTRNELGAAAPVGSGKGDT